MTLSSDIVPAQLLAAVSGDININFVHLVRLLAWLGMPY